MGEITINGVRLPDEGLAAEALRERAYGELLRQEALRSGFLPASESATLLWAPHLTEQEQELISEMLEAEVTVPVPDEEACRRYYEAHGWELRQGQRQHLRHILFAVTQRVLVPALAQRAEAALAQLKQARLQGELGLFASLARELSNCPSGQQGGDLGWVSPRDCVPEFAREMFHTPVSAAEGGVLKPRLIHSRFGFHIVEVLAVEEGYLPAFAAIRDEIATRLEIEACATALRHYMQRLVGQAVVVGITLEGAASPLLQ